MNLFKKIGILALSVLLLFSLQLTPNPVSADAVPGDVVVTLGQDLTQEQQDQILREMGVDRSVEIIYVTNEEEHRYLGHLLSKATIGKRALSSAKITLKQSGSGISIKTRNITTITNAMYANAVITAGLTGIIKAFEKATGKTISEKHKQVATEEIVRTQDVAKQIGGDEKQAGDKAAQFINQIKLEVANEKPETPEEYRDIIINVAQDLDIKLDNTLINQLVVYAQNFASLNIELDTLVDQIDKLRGSIGEILTSDAAKGFFDVIFEFIGDIFRAIGNFFSNLIS